MVVTGGVGGDPPLTAPQVPCESGKSLTSLASQPACFRKSYLSPSFCTLIHLSVEPRLSEFLPCEQDTRVFCLSTYSMQLDGDKERFVERLKSRGGKGLSRHFVFLLVALVFIDK